MAESAGHASSIPCCIAGGGPAGMMLGYLMARAGVRTVVRHRPVDREAHAAFVAALRAQAGERR